MQEVYKNLLKNSYENHSIIREIERNMITGMILFVDVETSGIPKQSGFDSYYNYDDNNAYEDCRIVQLSYAIVKPSGIVDKRGNYYIKQTISVDSEELLNVSNHQLKKYGILISNALEQLINVAKCCSYIAAHSIPFTLAMIQRELYLANMNVDVFDDLKSLSIGHMCRDHVNKIGGFPEYKFPSLVNLAKIILCHEMKVRYNSKHDLAIVISVFFKIRNICWL
jgi:hypothetical protein